jgi:hypothetical protein
MINTEEKIVMGTDNQLLEGIATIAGEPRMRHLYLSDTASLIDTKTLWEEILGGKVRMVTKESAIASGLFGNEVSLDAAERMGDLIAIAQGSVVILDPERADKEGAMIGHHGGESDIESSVPLFTYTIN